MQTNRFICATTPSSDFGISPATGVSFPCKVHVALFSIGRLNSPKHCKECLCFTISRGVALSYIHTLLYTYVCYLWGLSVGVQLHLLERHGGFKRFHLRRGVLQDAEQFSDRTTIAQGLGGLWEIIFRGYQSSPNGSYYTFL